MNWDQIEGKWQQITGKVKNQWGKIADDELVKIAGNRDMLIGKVQERYGVKKEEAERQIDEFAESLKGVL